MNCPDVRPMLNAWVDGELDSTQRTAIDSHLTACRSCADAQRELENVRDQIRSQMIYHKAPVGLRDQVQFALRGAELVERKSQRRDWRVWGAVAAAIVLGGVCSIPFLVHARTERQLVAEELFAAHARALMGREVDVISTDRHTVKPWFNGKLPFSPPVIDLAPDGFPLEGGRLDYAGGRAIAALVYRRALHRIDVFVWPSTSAGSAPGQFERNGYREISWARDDFSFTAISDLNPQELNQFVSLLKTR
jgi:anti-sigma factor RsiW